MRKKNLKMISAILAMVTALTIAASGCGNKTDDQEEIVTNVITQAENGESAAEVTEDAPEQSETPITEIAVDENGNVVTDAAGEPVTQQVTTAVPDDQDGEDFFATFTTKPALEIETSVESSERYAYSTLTDDEKALYDAIVGAASTMSTRIFGTQNLDIAEWTKVFGLVYNQEPQLFWLNSKSVVGKLYYNEVDTEKIASMQKEIDATVDTLLKEANTKSTTFDKLLVFHDYLVLNSTFKESDGAGSFNQTIYNAFANGTSKQGNIQCSGYAKAMQYLCDKAGIECMVITGTTEQGVTHAWNKVKVDGEWYNLDTTWDDPILSVPKEKYLRYNYFLVPDSWINEVTHFNISSIKLSTGTVVKYFDPPKATADAQNYFVKNGMVYNDRDSADKALKAALDKTVSEGMVVAHIMLGSDELYNEMSSDLKGYQTYVKDKNSNVTKLTASNSPELRIIQLNVIY